MLVADFGFKINLCFVTTSIGKSPGFSTLSIRITTPAYRLQESYCLGWAPALLLAQPSRPRPAQRQSRAQSNTDRGTRVPTKSRTLPQRVSPLFSSDHCPFRYDDVQGKLNPSRRGPPHARALHRGRFASPYSAVGAIAFVSAVLAHGRG